MRYPVDSVMRLRRLRIRRLLVLIVAIGSLVPCILWLGTATRYVSYDYDRPDAEQPFFKSLGLLIRLTDYFPLFLVCLVLLLSSVTVLIFTHQEIASSQRFLRDSTETRTSSFIDGRGG